MTGIVIRGDLRLGAGRLMTGLDLHLMAGKWSVLLGASGLGKTSLARLITGLPTPARMDGTLETGTARRPVGIGLMSQDDQLLPWATVLENVVISARLAGQRIRSDRARDLLARAGLAGLEQRKPAALSAGQRQRVTLARALYDDRPVMILDEPFSALDVLTRHRMQDLAAKLLAGRTVLLITHDPAEAVRLADHCWILTTQGARAVTLPDAPAPRLPDAPDTLTAQGRLWRQLSNTSPDTAPA